MGRKIIFTYPIAGRVKGDKGWKVLWEPITVVIFMCYDVKWTLGEWDGWCQVSLMVPAESVFRNLGNTEKGSVGSIWS